MPETKEQSEQSSEETDDQVQVQTSTNTSEDRKDAFGLDEGGGKTELQEQIENIGGDEGVEDQSELQDLDPDMTLDDLASGASAQPDRDVAPSDDEPVDADSEPKPSEPESDEAQTEGPTTDLDGDVLELAQEHEDVLKQVAENPEKVQNLQEWETKLTQQSQAIKDLDRLADVRQMVAADPGRAQAFKEFLMDVQDGKYDADREVDMDIPEPPEEVQGTEYEDFFQQMAEQQKNLVDHINRQKKMLAQQRGNQQPPAQNRQGDVVGDDQGAPATDQFQEIDQSDVDEVDQKLDEFEDFKQEHPELTDENGDPTPELEEIKQLWIRTGGTLDWDQAYYSVLGEQAVTDGNQSSDNGGQQESGSNGSATPTSELEAPEGQQQLEDQGEHEKYQKFTSSKGTRGELTDAIKRRL
jgi:hypothetical protein